MDEGAWWAAVYGVAQSWTRLSDFTFFFSWLNPALPAPTPTPTPGPQPLCFSLELWSDAQARVHRNHLFL